MILIKNADVFAPEALGKKDILIAGHRIAHIDDSIDLAADYIRTIDAAGKKIIPGIIDRHMHITGGGGEGGMTTRVPEVKASDLINNGITTVVGLLGTDSVTRTLKDLVAKAKSLNELGIHTYVMTGAYGFPPVTLIGDVQSDMAFIGEIIGCKIAISDHRAPHISTKELIHLAANVYVGGKISGHPGILTIHMGDGQEGLKPVRDAIAQSDLPASVFHPTHLNRNPELLEEAIAFLAEGGYVDLTCKMPNAPTDIVQKLLGSDIPLDRLTISSDGNGSYSSYDEDGNLLEIGAASVTALHEELQTMINEAKIPPEIALKFFTSHVAASIGLGAKKGSLKVGYDADLLIVDQDFNIESTISSGELLMHEKVIQKLIPFE